MKLCPLALLKIAAVLAVAYVLLGCEAPTTSAGDQVPPLYPAVNGVPKPDLVTVQPASAPVPAAQPIAAPAALPETSGSGLPTDAEAGEGEQPATPVALSDRL